MEGGKGCRVKERGVGKCVLKCWTTKIGVGWLLFKEARGQYQTSRLGNALPRVSDSEDKAELSQGKRCAIRNDEPVLLRSGYMTLSKDLEADREKRGSGGVASGGIVLRGFCRTGDYAVAHKTPI
jgi:hypothetical protein